MATVVWSERALHSLEIYANYIGQDSIELATKFVQNVFRLTDKLIKFPRLGRIVPEHNDPELREIIFKNHRIVYELHNITPEIEINILFVQHCRQQLQV